MSWRGRVSRVGGHLVYPDGCHFTPYQITAFGLGDHRLSLDRVWQYVDWATAWGVNGFRCMIGCAWGANHQGSDGWGWQWGGQQWPQSAQDRATLNSDLFNYLEFLAKGLKKRGCFLQIEMTDGSQNLVGDSWYLVQDHGWDLLCEKLAYLSMVHDNLLIATGNEPGRWTSDTASLYTQQKWLVERLHTHGCRLVMAECDGPGLSRLCNDPGVDVIMTHATRKDDIQTQLQTNYEELTRLKRFGKPVWSNEPARIGYPGWATVDDIRLLMWQTAVIGCGWTLHGMSELKPIYGVAECDGIFMMPFFRERWDSIDWPRWSAKNRYWFDDWSNAGIWGGSDTIHECQFYLWGGGDLYKTAAKYSRVRTWNLRTQNVSHDMMVQPGDFSVTLPGGHDFLTMVREGSQTPPVPA